MMPKTHIILGFVFSLILYLFFHVSLFNSILIFLATFLGDVDHYIFYMLKKRTLNFKESYNWFLNVGKRFDKLPSKKKKHYHLGYFPLHSIECFLVLFILGFYFNFLFFILIGLMFHTAMDMVYEYFGPKRALYKISIIYTVLTKKFIGF